LSGTSPNVVPPPPSEAPGTSLADGPALDSGWLADPTADDDGVAAPDVASLGDATPVERSPAEPAQAAAPNARKRPATMGRRRPGTRYGGSRFRGLARHRHGSAVAGSPDSYGQNLKVT